MIGVYTYYNYYRTKLKSVHYGYMFYFDMLVASAIYALWYIPIRVCFYVQIVYFLRRCILFGNIDEYNAY